MDELLAKHRKQQRDLQSQITQKKKQASKKTRKSVNDECDILEKELKRKQEEEIRAFNGEAVSSQENGDGELTPEQIQALTLQVDEDETTAEKPTTNGSSTTPTPSEHPNEGGRKPNRQKARLARRAAEQEAIAAAAAAEADNLPDLKQQERERMLAAMAEHDLVEKEIRADGHCLYSAVADQAQVLGMPLKLVDGEDGEKGVEAYRRVRYLTAEYMEQHRDDFEPFLEEGWHDYVKKVRDTGEWGGHVELMALAKGLGVDICVLRDFGRIEKFEGGKKDGESKELWLGYYKHGFGLGEHYNSLRKKGA